MAIGQNDGAGNALTVGANQIQTGAGIIGYDKIGIFAGMYKDGATYEPRFSLKGSGGNYLKWNGSGLELSGAITVTPGGNAATETYASASAAAAYSQALSIVNSLAGGTYNIGDTFITNNIISAPVIAGTAGYIAKLFRVGDTSSAGIFLDARTTSDVPPAPDNYRRIWIGTGDFGIHGDPNTSFYVDSDGKFSLKDKLTLSAAGNLSLTGDITANSGTFNGTINASGGTFTGNVTAGTGGSMKFGGNVSGTDNGIYIDGNNYWLDGEGRFKVGSSTKYFSWAATEGAVAQASSGVALWVDSDGTNPGFAALYVNDGGLKVFNTLAANAGYSIDCGSIRGSTATFSGDVTANTSDKRLKNNIVNIDSALEKISKINGVYFNWNETAKELIDKNTEIREVGFIAQEVQSVLPEIIKPAPFDVINSKGGSISGENYLTIQYEKIVPLLLEAIKELKAEIEELKKK
jgi:hypothetical protein